MAFSHTEMSLLAVLIGMGGLASGKVWGTSQLKTLRDEFRDLHNRCHEACKAARILKEFELEANLKELTVLLKTELATLKKGQDNVASIIARVNNELNLLGREIAKNSRIHSRRVKEEEED